MKLTWILLASGILTLAACTDTTGTATPPSGGAAGAMGEGFCETPPSDPDDMAQWEELCMPDRG